MARRRSVDDLFDRYFDAGKNAPIVAFISDNFSARPKNETPAEDSPVAEAAEIELLKFFVSEYLNQYRHYDNQRAKLAGILVAAVVGFSIVPFQLTPHLGRDIFEPIMVFVSAATLTLIALISNVAARKHRFRMKTAYHRYKLAQAKLDQLISGAGIREIEDEGKQKARDEMASGNSRLGEGREHYNKTKSELRIETHTRGFVWNLLPYIVMAYSTIYFFVYFFSNEAKSVYDNSVQWITQFI